MGSTDQLLSRLDVLLGRFGRIHLMRLKRGQWEAWTLFTRPGADGEPVTTDERGLGDTQQQALNDLLTRLLA